MMLAIEELGFEMIFGWRKPREFLNIKEKMLTFMVLYRGEYSWSYLRWD